MLSFVSQIQLLVGIHEHGFECLTNGWQEITVNEHLGIGDGVMNVLM
jgi:hypothetical protein